MAQLSIGHVFMSYSRRDEETMRRIVTFLRNQGIKVWVDNEKLIPGTPIWEEEIEKAIKGRNRISRLYGLVQMKRCPLCFQRTEDLGLMML
jgi:hypothetical protein